MKQSDDVYVGTSRRPTVRGTRHVVVAGHYLAAHAGFEILEAGGNAVDAGVAAALVEGVVQPDQVNFAGIAPIMLYSASSKTVRTIPGVGYWPKAASCEMFVREHGGTIPEGLLRTVVPAAPAALLSTLKQFGTMSFGHVARAAVRMARDGFSIHPFTSAKIEAFSADYGRWVSNSEVFLPRGRAPKPGELFRQADLAGTLQYLIDEERVASPQSREAGIDAAYDAFYRGDVAQTIADFHRKNDGLLAFEDMSNFAMKSEPATRASFGFGEVCTCGFWGQGPTILQALQLLSPFDLRALGFGSSGYVHVVTEALKLAFSDRESYYGDPDFTEVPVAELMSEEYVRRRRKMIRQDTAWPGMPQSGELGTGRKVMPAPDEVDDRKDQSAGCHDTSYVCVVDSHGNVFSASPSDTSHDTVMIPGTGLCPSSRGSQSRAVPGHAASIEPGKRPRATPNPVMVLRDGEPYLAFGSPGGDVQPQANLQALLGAVVFGMDIQMAVEAPRFRSVSFPSSFAPHVYRRGVLQIESGFDAVLEDELRRLGHRVEWLSEQNWSTGGVCMVRIGDPEPGIIGAAADSRRAGYALGW